MFRSLGKHGLVEIVFGGFTRFIWCARQTTIGASILDDLGDQTCPAGLMRCADTAASVAVKVFVEENMIAEMGIVVTFAVGVVESPFTPFVTEENVR